MEQLKSELKQYCIVSDNLFYFNVKDNIYIPHIIELINNTKKIQKIDIDNCYIFCIFKDTLKIILEYDTTKNFKIFNDNFNHINTIYLCKDCDLSGGKADVIYVSRKDLYDKISKEMQYDIIYLNKEINNFGIYQSINDYNFRKYGISKIKLYYDKIIITQDTTKIITSDELIDYLMNPSQLSKFLIYQNCDYYINLISKYQFESLYINTNGNQNIDPIILADNVRILHVGYFCTFNEQALENNFALIKLYYDKKTDNIRNFIKRNKHKIRFTRTKLALPN